jgi:hypothetical protein
MFSYQTLLEKFEKRLEVGHDHSQNSRIKEEFPLYLLQDHGLSLQHRKNLSSHAR